MNNRDILEEFLEWTRDTTGHPKLDVEIFIKNHTYINYCEAIIYRDGTISYVKPNHIQTLIRATGKSEREIYDLMPLTANPLHWLIDYSGCVAVWSQGFKSPEDLTSEQLFSLTKLFESGLVKRNWM